MLGKVETNVIIKDGDKERSRIIIAPCHSGGYARIVYQIQTKGSMEIHTSFMLSEAALVATRDAINTMLGEDGVLV